MSSSRSFLLLLLASSLPATANDWPRFRGPHGDNSLPEAKIATSFPDAGPKVLWSIDVHEGYGGAAISGEEVYFMDRADQEKDILVCVGLADGKERWRWEHPVAGRISHPGSRVVPTVTEDAIYGGSGFGHVYCIDRKTHEKRWVVDVAKTFEAQPPRFGYAVHPVILGGMCIIAPTGDAVGLAALDKKTGKTLWRSKPVGESHSSPILANLLGREMLVMPGTGDGKYLFTGFAPKTGEQLFQYSEDLGPGRFNPIPNITVIDKETAFLTGGYGRGTKVLKFSEADGKITVRKINEIAAGSTLHPVLRVGDRFYLTSGRGSGGSRFGGRSRGGPRPGGESRPQGGGGRPSGGGGGGEASGFVCIDAGGKVLWNTGNEPGLGEGSIINAGGIIISQDGGDGSLRLIKPGPAYKELAKAKVFSKEPGNELWAPMALSNGKLVMRSQVEMICVEVGAATSE